MWDSSLCVRMWYLSEGEGWLQETCGIVATLEYSGLEVGWHKHGFHCGFTFDCPQVWFDLGDCGSTYQVFSLHTHQHHLQGSEVCWDIHCSSAMLARSSEDNHLWSGSQFVARFWEQLHASLGTHSIHSLAYHPQTNGKIERVNQILEDMLWACVMEYPGTWDKNLHWEEFLYNNNYQESLKMAPFEVLYGRQCRTPLN
jgi:hypothetical protein